MGLYNILRTNMTCPYCNRLVDIEIDLFFGDTRAMDEYAIGDRYRWIPGKAVHNGGRPESGNLDGEGYTECPRCGRDFFVKVLVRDDALGSVEPDLDKPSYLPSSAAVQEKPVRENTRSKGGNRQKKEAAVRKKAEQGMITYNPNWKLAKKREVALLRLAELGVRVGSTVGSDDFRLLVPFDLHPDVYVEVGYLMAQLGNEDFPNGFHHPISNVETKLFDRELGARSPVSAGDSVLQGYRYYVTLEKESE